MFLYILLCSAVTGTNFAQITLDELAWHASSYAKRISSITTGSSFYFLGKHRWSQKSPMRQVADQAGIYARAMDGVYMVHWLAPRREYAWGGNKASGGADFAQSDDGNASA